MTWPTGVAGKGNDGVTALIKQTPGAIGYIEYGYAQHNKLPFAALQNKSGEFVTATTASGAATLATTQFPADLLRAWPSLIRTEKTRIRSQLLPGCYSTKTTTTLRLVRRLRNSSISASPTNKKFAEDLGYIPLPKEVVDKNLEALKTVK